MADITVTIPNSTFTITEVGSGIEVTTPTSVEVNVDTNSNTIDIVNTPQQITVLTSGTLNINTGNAVTSVNGISGPTVVLDTDDISEGTTNKYFSQALARQSLSAGTGISYDNATGVITNTSINTNTTYTIDATTASGGANFNLVGSDSSTDTIKIASGTNITVSRTDANTITIDGSDLNTTYAISSASTTGGANLTLTGSDSSTDSVAYKGSGATTVTSTDANTITIASTDTNTTYTQNASAATGGANLNLVGSDSSTDTIKFAEGTGITVVRTDADTITITNTVPDTNTTYTIASAATSGGANLTLTGSDASTDSVAYLGSGATTVTSTDANTVTISSTDTNTTYTQNASAVSGGANLNLVGSDSTTDSIKLASGTNVTVTRTDDDTVTIASTDTNTTYTQNISSTTGGANLNLVGSDSTTDTVKFADGTGVTVSYTDANTATIAIGQSVGTGDSPSFAGGTFGNITVGVDTDNTIGTTNTNGNIILDPNGTGDIVLTLVDGGNLTNSRNYVLGAIRNATTETNGDAWSFSSGAGTGFRGITIDNSANTAKTPVTVLRSFTGGAVAGNATTPTVLFERARGTSAVPTAIQNGDLLGRIVSTGANGTNTFIGDSVAASPASLQFLAAENFSGTTNVGTQMSISLMPTGKTLASVATPTVVFGITPQSSTQRSDNFTWQTGNTTALPGSTTTLTLDSNGNLVVTGDLRVNGNDILASDGLTNISLTSNTLTTLAGDLRINGNDIQASDGLTNISLTSNTLTTLAGDLRINGNDIQGSGGLTAIQLTSANTNLFTYSDSLTVNDAAGNQSVYFNNAAKQINMNSGSIGILSLGDVNIAQMGSTWQSAFSPGFKYTGLASSGTLTNNGTLFEMSSRWKASSGTSTYAPPQNTWGIGAFQFSADASTTNTNQKVAGQIRVEATENWDATHFGTKITLDANILGNGGGRQVASFSPETSTISSDLLTFNISSGSSLPSGKISYGRQYIEAYSTVDQTNPVANAENLMSFNNTGISNGISIVTNGTTPTRITMSNAGVYNIQFSAKISIIWTC